MYRPPSIFFDETSDWLHFYSNEYDKVALRDFIVEPRNLTMMSFMESQDHMSESIKFYENND